MKGLFSLFEGVESGVRDYYLLVTRLEMMKIMYNK
jgi:hypothetical protein